MTFACTDVDYSIISRLASSVKGLKNLVTSVADSQVRHLCLLCQLFGIQIMTILTCFKQA